MEVSDFLLKLLYAEKRERERLQAVEMIIRAQTLLLLQIQVKEKVNIDQLWPVDTGEEQDAAPQGIDKERLRAIQETIKKVWG